MPTFKTTEQLKAAFAADGFEMDPNVVTINGRRGIVARHKTAVNSQTGRPKKAYYVEGSGYDMGFLVGLLGTREVRAMTKDFVRYVIPAFVAPDQNSQKGKVLFDLLLKLGVERTLDRYRKYPADIPQQLWEEMQGLADGCSKGDLTAPVSRDEVLALNTGFDCILASLYTGLGLDDYLNALEDALSHLLKFAPGIREAHAEVKTKLNADMFRVPVGCNALAAFGNATSGGKAWFGRDFQFPTGGIFQNQACMIIYNPDYSLEDGSPAQPIVSMTAPGFAGSVCAMSAKGVALGVHVVMGSCSSFERPGLNSLLLVRHAGHHATSMQQVVDTIVAAQRGVSWMYPIADGDNQQACVVEAGMTTDKYDPLAGIGPALRKKLPRGPFTPARKGLMVRPSDWQYPAQYLNYNPALFAHYGMPYDAAAAQNPTGYLCPNWSSGKLPFSCYFPPQREVKPDILVVNNHYIIPEMRLSSMDEWVGLLHGGHRYDFQWRHDELNRQALDAYGRIDEAKALELTDFLAPYRKFPGYYLNKPTIEGSVSLCDLTVRKMTSHYGYFADDWVAITLSNYVT